LLGLSGLARQVSIIEASMPTAVTTGVLATEFGSDTEFTTAVILVSTLASIVTLSVLLTLVM
jgi:predicted permease